MAEHNRGNIQIQALDLKPSYLDTERMKTLMTVGKTGEMLLYMNVSCYCTYSFKLNIDKKHRLSSKSFEIWRSNPGSEGKFKYIEFTNKLASTGFADMQNSPLDMRLDLLESYVNVPPRPPPIKKMSGFHNK